MTQMFLQVFYMIPPDTESLEELLYAFSRFTIQGEIIAPYGFARCALHAMLFYFLKKLRVIYIHVKHEKMTVSELMGSMEEPGESPKKKFEKKKIAPK